MPPKTVIATLPVIVFVLSYTFTTVVAATGYIFGFTHWLSVRQGPTIQAALATIGSPSYILLLYLPLVLTPAAAFMTIFVVRRWSAGTTASVLPARLTISRAAVSALIAISAFYCFVTLLNIDALNADVFAAGTYIEKTTRRMSILESGYIFFTFAYGINIILPLIAFISYVQQGRRAVDGALFLISYILFVTVIVLTFSKAPIAIYVVLALATFAVIRPPVLPAILMIAFSIAIFAFTNVAFLQPAFVTEKQPAFVTEKPSVTIAPALVAPAAEPTEPELFTPLSRTLSSAMMKLTSDVSIFLNRMAMAHPYHVAIFADPAERCGIQGNAIRRIVGLPPPKCVLPEKAFSLMFPEVDWIKGYQPAPASLSAYAELGMAWSITVMILSGIALGGLGSLAAATSGPVTAALCVAICGLGYDFSQVPFLASFTYPHGFFAFFLAVTVTAAPELLKRLRRPSRSEDVYTRSA